MQSKALKKIIRNPTAVICIVILAVLIVSCVFSDVLAPYGFDEQQLHNARQGPSAEHIFGTDEYGRDIFSRILYGGKTSIVIGFAAVLLSVAVGGTLGMLAGYYKKAEMIIMRLVDIQVAIPGILFAIVIVATLGDSLFNVVISVAIFSIPTMIRVVRSEVLSMKQSEFVLAARTYGLPSWRILLATMRFASSVLTSATLSFLGLGVKPPMADWGSMISNGRMFIRTDWWVIVFPGLALLILTLAVNLLGDALRDALDPKVQ